jgi:hypothetical protein
LKDGKTPQQGIERAMEMVLLGADLFGYRVYGFNAGDHAAYSR